jgi:hypothetical protein
VVARIGEDPRVARRGLGGAEIGPELAIEGRGRGRRRRRVEEIVGVGVVAAVGDRVRERELLEGLGRGEARRSIGAHLDVALAGDEEPAGKAAHGEAHVQLARAAAGVGAAVEHHVGRLLHGEHVAVVEQGAEITVDGALEVLKKTSGTCSSARESLPLSSSEYVRFTAQARPTRPSGDLTGKTLSREGLKITASRVSQGLMGVMPGCWTMSVTSARARALLDQALNGADLRDEGVDPRGAVD